MTDQNNNVLTNSLLTSHFVCQMQLWNTVNQRCPKTTSVFEDKHMRGSFGLGFACLSIIK